MVLYKRKGLGGSMRIPFLSRLLEIKEEQLQIENTQTLILNEILIKLRRREKNGRKQTKFR